MFQVLFVYFLLDSSSAQLFTDEAIYSINNKRALHSVSERFLSISIDPAVLLTGFNLSDSSLELAKHLSPAFIRIAGPSTKFVKYVDVEEKSDETANIVITPSMWFGINEWLNMANLTPVFGINDGETTKGGWNPKPTMALLEISDKFNVSCYWQLGYDCSNKTQSRYKEDLLILRHILDAFPDKSDVWKIVGSDVNRCSNDGLEVLRSLEQLEGSIAATVWEADTKSNNLLLMLPIKPKVSLWAVSAKEIHPVSFSSAITWAHEIGEAARMGYEVLFRQPRMHEIFAETPAYWVSVFHKALMGQIVLDVRQTSSGHNPHVSLYSHCTRHQNNFVRSGAMTILMINNATNNHTNFIRLGSSFLKNIEVQSYILTSPSEDSTEVYLNDHKINLESFDGDRTNFLPKLRRAKIVNYLSISLPPKSIGFFVLPSARASVCMNEQNEIDLLLEEINEDQNIKFADEVSVDLPQRSGFRQPTLGELRRLMQKELENDLKYYKNVDARRKWVKPTDNPREAIKEARNYFIERAKHKKQENQEDTTKKQFESIKSNLFQMLKEKQRKREEENQPKELELELTSEEIRKILADRARTKAAKKHIMFTSKELDEILDKATDKFLNNKNTLIKIRRKVKREIPRDKKDINMKLLNLKTLGANRRALLKQIHNITHYYHHKRREPRNISIDLIKKLKSELRKDKNHPREVFAEMAEEPTDEGSKKIKVILNNVVLQKKLTSTTVKPEESPKPTFVEVREFDGVDSWNEFEDYPCIHEFGVGTKRNKEMKMMEFGESMKSKRLPSLSNRIRVLHRSKDRSIADISLENDYGDLESDEKTPLRLKRAESVEKYHYVIGKGYDPSKIKIDGNMKERQIKMLKDRLVRKKKQDFINNNKKKMLRKTRSLKELSDNSFNGRYKSLTEGLRDWKPSDVLHLKRNFVRSPNLRLLDEIKRTKRSVASNINSIENEIDSFMNEIAKETDVIVPKLDSQNGDYQLIFPNKDKIEVVADHGNAELKLVLHQETTTEPNPITTSNIQQISKNRVDTVWEKLFNKITGIFKGLSDKVRSYIKEEFLK